LVRVRDFPDVAFDFEMIAENEVVFTNRSTGAGNYRWDFGDGQFSTEENPVHLYDSSGVFEVTLNAQNESCASALAKTLAIFLTSVPSPTLPEGVMLFPNPAQGYLNIRSEDASWWPLNVRLFNIQGQLQQQRTLEGNDRLDIHHLPAGTYILTLENRERAWTTRVVVW
jgi:hypothetical protein